MIDQVPIEKVTQVVVNGYALPVQQGSLRYSSEDAVIVWAWEDLQYAARLADVSVFCWVVP